MLVLLSQYSMLSLFNHTNTCVFTNFSLTLCLAKTFWCVLCCLLRIEGNPLNIPQHPMRISLMSKFEKWYQQTNFYSTCKFNHGLIFISWVNYLQLFRDNLEKTNKHFLTIEDKKQITSQITNIKHIHLT